MFKKKRAYVAVMSVTTSLVDTFLLSHMCCACYRYFRNNICLCFYLIIFTEIWHQVVVYRAYIDIKLPVEENKWRTHNVGHTCDEHFRKWTQGKKFASIRYSKVTKFFVPRFLPLCGNCSEMYKFFGKCCVQGSL